MKHIRNIIEHDDVEWIKDKKANPKEIIFERGKALSCLLLNDVVKLNENVWSKYIGFDDEILPSLNICCTNLFTRACKDSIVVFLDDIEPLYRLWNHEHRHGHRAFSIIKRKRKPLKDMAFSMREAGWDIDWLLSNSLESITEQLRPSPVKVI